LILKVKSPADGWIAAINFRLDQELVEESGAGTGWGIERVLALVTTVGWKSPQLWLWNRFRCGCKSSVPVVGLATAARSGWVLGRNLAEAEDWIRIRLIIMAI